MLDLYKLERSVLTKKDVDEVDSIFWNDLELSKYFHKTNLRFHIYKYVYPYNSKDAVCEAIDKLT